MTPPEPSLSSAELTAHAAYLRALARGLLGRGAEVDDLVQDTFVAALEHPPRSGGGLRAWLATVARHRAIGLRRGASRREAREADAARPEAGPDASEALERLELAQRLAAEVARLREPYRTAIYLRYHEGLAPSDIAARLGEPQKTVKTHLARALELLRERLDARDGGREAWSAALLPLAFPRSAPLALAPAAPPLAAVLTVGLAVKKLAFAAALVVAVLLAWQGVRVLSSVYPRARDAGETAALLRTPVRIDAIPVVEAPGAQAPRVPLPVEVARPPATTGDLSVSVSWLADGRPVADLCVDLYHFDDPAPRDARRHARTDADGRATFADLPPGRAILFAETGASVDVEIHAGSTSEAKLELPDEHRIDGRVVDPEGAPVVGAGIWVRVQGREDGTHRVATSGADGRFRLRGLADDALLGAIAAGRQPSLLFDPAVLPVGPTGAREVTLELGPPGGTVAGRVLDPDGEPLAGAVVVVDVLGGFQEDLPSGLPAMHPQGVHLVTDAKGEFQDPGDVRNGTWPVFVAAQGYALWTGEAQVEQGRRAWLEVHLERGARVRGRVVDGAGNRAADVLVELTTKQEQEYVSGPFASVQDHTDEQGLFALDWIPSGPHELLARSQQSDRLGRARASIQCAPGGDLEVELVLDPGATIRGRVVDAQDRPLADWTVRGEAEGWFEQPGGGLQSWNLRRSDRTQSDGSFLLATLDRPGVPADIDVRLRVSAPGQSPFPPRAELRGVKPGAEDVLLRVEQADVEPGRLRGHLLDAGGAVPLDVRLTVWDEAETAGLWVDVDPRTGAFEHEVTLPGRYTLRVLRGGSTLESSGPHEVIAGGTTEVGVIAVGDPGHVEVRLLGVPEDGLRFARFEVTGPAFGWKILELEDGRYRSPPLQPGAWNLHLGGKAWFAPDQGLEVRAGETLQVEVEAVAGLEVDLSFDFANPEAVWNRVEVEIRDDADALMRRYGPVLPFQLREGLLELHGLSLPPGRFSVLARTDTGLQGSGTIMVPAPPSARTENRFTIR